MIVVRLVGRLGNQLFQYAFAMSEQKRLGIRAVIDDRSMGDRVSQYFRVRGIFRSRILKKIVFRLNKFPTVYQDGAEDIASFFKDRIRNSINYYAYFQSEDYFAGIRNKLWDRFRIRKSFRDAFEEKYGALYKNNKILAIHCRFGDYKDYHREELGGTNFVLPESYYENALDRIPDLDDYLVVMVTDDPQACNDRTPRLKNKLLINDSEIMDFMLLMNADKLIIANSTFSWWAAYLNPKDPEIFAPEYWLGFKVNREFPNGIIPDRFTKIRVYSAQ
jgi:hypothetical protein